MAGGAASSGYREKGTQHYQGSTALLQDEECNRCGLITDIQCAGVSVNGESLRDLALFSIYNF